MTSPSLPPLAGSAAMAMASSSSAPRAIARSSEDICSHFECVMCTELVHKPIVLACGHIFCFWCLHKSMDRSQLSRCPLCKELFCHFPRVCQLLHNLLLKIVPEQYTSRGREVQDEERKIVVFSPQILDDLISKRTVSVTDFAEGLEVLNTKEVCVADVECSKCKELLYRPIVMNCGHVYCKTCLTGACKQCDFLHAEKTPDVCLLLHQFLEDQFPLEYNRRKIQLEGKSASDMLPVIPDTEGAHEYLHDKFRNTPRSVHSEVGCDSCGMYPISGKRYRCLNCIESAGYDLCQECHDRGLHPLGMFGQQHKPEHRFVVDGSMLFRQHAV